MRRAATTRRPQAGSAQTALLVAAFAAAGWLRAPAGAAAQASDRPNRPSTAHVRGLDRKTSDLVDKGRARSVTFRHLCETLEQTDVIVLVDTGFLKVPGQTTFLAASHAARFLRVTLDVPQADDELLAWLAHELQHAVEIASAPAVVSGATMAAFFRQHGQTIGNGFCTWEAQRARRLVEWELSVSGTTGR